jgi:outer membrane protein
VTGRAAGLALAVLLVATTAVAQTKIAVVDVQGALLQTEDGLKAAATLKRYSQSRQADLDKRQNDLIDEQEEIRKQARVLSRRALQRRTEHWQRRMVEVQTKFIEYNKQLQKQQADLMSPIMRKLFQAIRRAANRRGYDVVIDKSAVPYSNTDLDLTDMVVQLYNSGDVGEEEKDEGEKKP